MRGAALLLILAAPPAPAAERTPVSAASAVAIEQVEKDFDQLCRRMEDDLDEARNIRAAYPLSAEKAALEARLDRAAKDQAEFNVEENALRREHRGRLQALQLLAVTDYTGRMRAGNRAPNPIDSMVLTYESAAQDMKLRSERLSGDFLREVAAVRAMRDAEARRADSRRAGLLRLTGALAILCLLAASLHVALRGSPAPATGAAVPGNFELVGTLGRGSMGEVYEAVDTSLNRRTALKRLRQELLQDPAELDGLLKEARLMASLKHPNLVSIYSVEKDGGQVYLALEFVDGTTLQRRLDAERRLPWPEALRIARGVGAALDYAHGMKVVHRDLKPANVMLSTKGEVKVMDFGIAHQAAKSVSRLTRAPAWGTPAYMAPEQELGGVSAAVDLYALSVCLYEMLTGELPFKGPNFLAQKREGLYAPPSGLAAGLPAGVDAVFAAALAPEPSRPFKSAAALLAACDALNS